MQYEPLTILCIIWHLMTYYLCNTPLRRRGKILFVWYGPDSSVTQRSTVMRKISKSNLI